MGRNCSCDREFFLKFEAEGRELFEITRTIYSNSERLEQSLVTECFFNLFLQVSQIKTIGSQTVKNYWDLETCRKS